MSWWQKLLGRSAPRSGRVEWGKEYPDWKSALADAGGYDSQAILDKVASASLAVQRGEFPYERDSVLFDHIEYSWPLLASLLWIHARLHRLRVLDFGGSLGSTWRQNQGFLGELGGLDWRVVEQQGFVERGKREFQIPPLSFHASIDEASQGGIDLFLLASSLCYIEDHRAVLEIARDSNAKFMILDRTPFHEGANDRIRLQTVPPEIYPASYPCHIFSRQRFHEIVRQDWTIHTEWNCELQPDPGATHRGMVLERKSS